MEHQIHFRADDSVLRESTFRNGQWGADGIGGDPRALGEKLGLFTFSPLVGKGLPLWKPKGAILRDTLHRASEAERAYRDVLAMDETHQGAYEALEALLRARQAHQIAARSAVAVAEDHADLRLGSKLEHCTIQSAERLFSGCQWSHVVS